jgi:hypothetical protein
MQKSSVYDRMTNAEKEVANVLKELGIQWSFEQPVFVWDENKRPRVWTSDFYLINFGIYLEVWCSEKFEYEYRKKIYNRNSYHVIFLHFYKDVNKWKIHLLRYLRIFMDSRNKRLNQIFQI